MIASINLLDRLSRAQALGIHLLFSAVVAAGVWLLMTGLWYPAPFFEVLEGGRLAAIVIGVNFVLGPVVAFFIFKVGKPGLKSDVIVLAAVQLGALAYGMQVVAEARPAYVVLVTDQFEVATAGELQGEQLARARQESYRRVPLDGPAIVFSDAPREGNARRDILLAVLAGGPDIHLRPEFYEPFSSRTREALGYSHPVERARRRWPAAAAAIDRYLAESGRKPAEVRYLSGRASRGWFVCVLDAGSGRILTMLAVDEAPS